MPNTHENLTSLFGDIADAIRAKTGSSADIVADNFPAEIAAIPALSDPVLYNMTYHTLEKTETLVTPSKGGKQDISSSFSAGTVLFMMFSVTKIGNTSNMSVNSGIIIYDKRKPTSDKTVAIVQTSNSYLPEINSVLGIVSLVAHYGGLTTEQYRVVKIAGYFE